MERNGLHKISRGMNVNITKYQGKQMVERNTQKPEYDELCMPKLTCRWNKTN